MKRIMTTLAAGTLAIVAAPAVAQDAALCGGVGASGQWIGGDQAGSDVSTAGSHLEQMALVLMRNEYVALFEVSAGTDVRIEAEGRGAGDPVIDIRDAGGTIILSDDDSGGGTASRVESYLDPGSYCVSMRSFDGSPMTGFVRVGRVADHEALTAGTDQPVMDDDFFGFDGGCDLSTAVPLSVGQPASGSADGTPYYRLSLDTPMALTLTAENQSADPVLTLYDAEGNWLAENDDFDGLNSRIDMAESLQPGEYCVAISALSDGSLPITVTATEYDAAAVMTGLFDRGEAAPPLDGSYPVTELGELASRLRQDVNLGGEAAWYTFEVTEASLVLIEAIAQGQGDPVLYLYDDLGRQVGYNDDAGDGTYNSLVTVRVQPGTYLAAVRQLQPDMQGFIRLVFERYVPAP